MFLNIIASDDEGQFLPSFSLEVKTFHIHGFTEGGMLIDITHMDGEKERVFLEGESRPFSPMKLEQLAQINTITLYDGYPASEILSKEEYRARVGCGALLTPAGHFKREERPAPIRRFSDDLILQVQNALLEERLDSGDVAAIARALEKVVGVAPVSDPGTPAVPSHYAIIRAGTGYDPVIVCSPPDAGPETEGAVFYERRSWGTNRNEFKQIDARSAMMAFSGHADGWGWAVLPSLTFADLDAVEAWIKS